MNPVYTLAHNALVFGTWLWSCHRSPVQQILLQYLATLPVATCAAAYTYGALMGQLACLGVPASAVSEVPATQWKARVGLRGLSKDDSRALAAQVLPDHADDLKCAISHAVHVAD